MVTHPTAIIESKSVHPSSKIWAFVHILPGAVVGANCNICDGVFIENDVIVGDRVTIKCGVQLWNGVHLEDDVFIGPNASFSNDFFPRSLDHTKPILKTKVLAGASIGANSTILPGITIGKKAMIGAGAVVTKSVPANAIVVGNPARIIGYTDTEKRHESQQSDFPKLVGKHGLHVRGASIHRFKHVNDLRGDLTVGNLPTEVPFLPARFFLVSNVPSLDVRGEHAHRECHQFLIATHGAISCLLDDGYTREEVRLDSPELGLYMPPKVWGVQYKYTPDAVLLVFASHAYDPSDYIRDYDEFCKIVKD